ncbi:MAG TPA: Gfo/Idh/MocA family oxidoreductase [Acidimicrobiales bacterium]|nr:Gfo/Idh/MocA family oxidoreductase [Acidimicrobiales bacterium]
MSRKLKIGVIGAGVISQVMHLHYLRELDDRYETVGICDLSHEVASACAREYGVGTVFTDWRDVLSEDIDAVFILTSGSHAPIAIEAARASGVILMVGYPKRYDPAFARFVDEAMALTERKLLRVTTTESPFEPYVAHYPLVGPPTDVDADLLAALRADSTSRVQRAIGTDDAFLIHQYHAVLLDTLVHEVNTTRALMGEPTSLDYVDLRNGHATVVLDFGGPRAVIHWLETPEMTRYSMEFSLHAANGRATLTFPSPYLRNAPSSLVVERGAGGTESWRREEITSYESGFKEELRVFYDAVSDTQVVPTGGVDANRDIALCQAIIRSFVDRSPVANPTDF